MRRYTYKPGPPAPLVGAKKPARRRVEGNVATAVATEKPIKVAIRKKGKEAAFTGVRSDKKAQVNMRLAPKVRTLLAKVANETGVPAGDVAALAIYREWGRRD